MQSDCVGNVVECFFKFNCSGGTCIVIIQNLSPEFHLNFLDSINFIYACRPAACKTLVQFQLGYSFDVITASHMIR